MAGEWLVEETVITAANGDYTSAYVQIPPGMLNLRFVGNKGNSQAGQVYVWESKDNDSSWDFIHGPFQASGTTVRFEIGLTCRYVKYLLVNFNPSAAVDVIIRSV